jgi:outer membrane scaffolding protein for murein synthesis (MipA/OmpV family)
MSAIRLALLLAALIAAQPIAAQDAAPAGVPTEPERRDNSQLTIGFGLGIAPDYEGSDNYRLQPGGVMQGKVAGIDFQMRGLNIYTDFVKDAPDSRLRVILGPVVQLRPERTGEIKDPRVAQLGDRDTAVELGFNAGLSLRGVIIPPASVTVDVTYLADVAGAHKSWTLTPSVSLSSPTSHHSFARLAISADYVGEGFARTYFDVGPGNILAPYATNGGGWKSASGTLLYIQDFGGDPRQGLGLFGIASYKRMLGKFAASPVVRDAGSANQALVVGGLLYGF